MGQPSVCILMPCLNARRFLEPRVESILAQTHANWRALVLDSGSTDGSWEFFTEVAARDPRFVLHQVPREGLYAALNRGIEMAEGDFLLIATCDDTMAPDFLARMLDALAGAPAAGVAACDLEFIDEHGRDALALARPRLGGAHVRTPVVGEVIGRPNFRPAPHDSVLHLAGETVYYSLTQLLVRLELAQRAPRFDTTVGGNSDFGWTLQLTNLAGTVHLPVRLTAWRFHGDQISVRNDPTRIDHTASMCRSGLKVICAEHRELLKANDVAALRIAVELIEAQIAGGGSASRIWLRAAWRIVAMFLERPARTLRALLGLRHRPGYLRQSWVAFVLRRLNLFPRPLE